MEMPKRVGITYRNARKAEPYVRALRAVGIEPVLIHPDEPISIDSLTACCSAAEAT